MIVLGVVMILLVMVILFVMLWNFWMEPNKFYGKYPIVFIVLKPCIVPLMLLYLYFTGDVPTCVIYFCVFCWLGDIILLWKSYLANTLGGICFLCAHLSIIMYYNVTWNETSLFAILLILPSTAVLNFVLFPMIFKYNWTYVGAIAYLICLNAALAAAVQRYQYMNPLSLGYILGFIGHEIFVASDFILVRGILMKKEDSQNFWVILTYVLAIVFILAGIGCCPTNVPATVVNSADIGITQEL